MASIREHTAKDGTTTYQVRYREGGRGAPARTKTCPDRKSAEDLMALMNALGPKRALAEIENTGAVTLDELLDPYLEWVGSRVRSERTVADYRRDYTNWISPALGWRTAETIDETDVQQWVDAMRAGTAEGNQGKALSAKSIHDRHAILHGLYKWASAPTRKYVSHNPAVGTELPRKTKKRPQGLRPAEWQALHAALKAMDPDAADLAEFLLASGWRWSEATALSTYEVEDFGDYVYVTMSQVARRQPDGSVAIVQDAKSEAGLRRIKLDAEASATVRRRVAKAKDGGLVFTTAEGSMFNYSHFLKRKWNKAVKAANLSRRPTIHALRHTAVGYLILSGKVSPVEIQRRIGHSNISTTMDVYGGMIEDVSDDALDAFAALRNTQPNTVTAGPTEKELVQ